MEDQLTFTCFREDRVLVDGRWGQLHVGCRVSLLTPPPCPPVLTVLCTVILMWHLHHTLHWQWSHWRQASPIYMLCYISFTYYMCWHCVIYWMCALSTILCIQCWSSRYVSSGRYFDHPHPYWSLQRTANAGKIYSVSDQPGITTPHSI